MASRIPRDSLTEKIEYVLSAIRGYGVDISPGSRLDQAVRIFLDEHNIAKREVPFEDPQFRVAQEALRDFLLLEPIFNTIAAIRLDHDRTNTIKTLLKDAVVPHATQALSKGRDLQAELLTAATCVLGGMSDVALKEPPDVQATFAGRTWGIAVKRLKSAERLDDNMRDAAMQVERAGMPGAILLDISLAFNQTSTPLFAHSADAFQDAQARRLRQIVDMNKRAIFTRAQAKRVGVVLSI